LRATSAEGAGDSNFDARGHVERRTQGGASVTNVLISLAAGILTFGFGYLGMQLQKLLPEDHMTSGSREMIGAVMGLITLLLALVLGTLVGSAYGFYAVQKSNIETLGARSIQLDMALEQYGPEAAPIRQGLQAAIKGAYDAVWNAGAASKPPELAAYLPELKSLNASIASLSPKTPMQTALLPTIGVNAGIIEQTRLLMSLQLASSVSWPLLEIVVSWAMLLFCGFGILSRLNATSVVAVLVGAFAVASAIFLILELNEPFRGLFRIPGASVEQTIKAIGN
jgi:hypothetical protein